jgi:hypothetical protein
MNATTIAKAAMTAGTKNFFFPVFIELSPVSG